MYENNLDPMDTAMQGDVSQDVRQPDPATGVGNQQTSYSDQATSAANMDQNDKMAIMKQPFDPATNQTDMASLQNVTSAADALNQMNPEQRTQAWPRIASGLIQDNPKLATMISVDKVPDQDQIDTVLNKNGKSLYPKIKTEEEEEEESTDEKADDTDDKTAAGEHSFAQLTQQAQGKAIQQLDELNTQVADLDEIAKDFRPEDFTMKRKSMGYLSALDERLGTNALSKQEHDDLGAYNARMNRITRLMLNYRRLITGTAGSDQEMKKIESTFLNPDMSASQARYEIKNLMTKFRRDALVKQNLLSRGVLVDNMSVKDYTSLFTAEREKVQQDIQNHMKELKLQYPQYKNKIDEDFALKHKIYWDTQQKQAEMQQQQTNIPQGGGQ